MLQFLHLPVAEPAAAEPPLDPPALLERLCAGHDLEQGEAEALFGALVRGDLDDAVTAAVLVALKMKGETVPEIAGAAAALRTAAEPFPRPDYLFADSCGTGGDGAHTINVSTAVAFTAAAAGLPIAKHGNRSISSRCGSADVLAALGVPTGLSAEQSRRRLDEAGVCFLFAPQYHPGLRHAGPVRRAIRVRTVMNILGPLLNPARPPVQIMGVAQPHLIEPAARALALLGSQRALVVHGSGLDEIALHGPTEAMLVEGGQASSMPITPEDAGLQRAPLEALKGGEPEENAMVLEAILKGQATRAQRDAVALNTGALLFVAGLAADVREGTALGGGLIDKAAPFERLQALRELGDA
ncbi:MAG TPA: anthranilate phosphoribosyltransferase [Caulobacteraceae bacterium]|jgi:anthranilate phosphoribosyltransferase